MASWRKLLRQMLEDTDPRSYRYDQAAKILGHLGFRLAKPTDGSHRVWRRRLESPPRTVVIGLVDAGNGTMKKVYVVAMLARLREHDLLPPLD